ncbi:hypothetical protein LCGC14_2188870 [marine sediment metagenome]|uniref:Uncharacterized protein n=1 Tax=marine sediment metagenome TaxID=412755 RepID=A0A0F9GFY9_9ZZZZ
MNIPKAIEIKARRGEEFLNTDPDELDEADRLSIEALKRVQEIWNDPHARVRTRLPGETEE